MQFQKISVLPPPPPPRPTQKGWDFPGVESFLITKKKKCKEMQETQFEFPEKGGGGGGGS